MDAVAVATVILWFAITLLAIIGMWKLSHRTPKGTVLILSILLIALSFVIDPSNWRMLYFLRGSIRWIGILGLPMGVLDLIDKRDKGGSK